MVVVTDPATCLDSAACGTGLCFRATVDWVCSGPCPCPDGWSCVAFAAKVQGCAPNDLAPCFGAAGGSGGTGGVGGTGGWVDGTGAFGAAGGFAGTGGFGGAGTGGVDGTGGFVDGTGGFVDGTGGFVDGTGGFGGTGATGGSDGAGNSAGGPCGGNTKCPGNVPAQFCGGSRMLDCKMGDTCPAATECSAYCVGCGCHAAPPINGVLIAECDTCQSVNDCPSGQSCVLDLYTGTGAMICN